MSSDEDKVSAEYASGDVTESLPDEPGDTESKNETEPGEATYGLAKPQRRRIRGKIIHGEG